VTHSWADRHAPPGIEIDDLTVRNDRTTALDGLSLRLDGGRIYGLIGRNGSGKTTLLSVLAAFRRPTSGTVRVAGADPFENERLTADICLVREGGDVVPERVDRVLALARDLRPRWDDGYARRLLDRFGVPLHRPLPQLSRGQRAAVACVLGLASRAPLTMFDESYLGMDAPARYAFYEELLDDYTAHPRTVIVSTHLVEEFGGLFEEVVMIHRGRLMVHDEADALRARGATLTGPVEEVRRAAAGLTTLRERHLGGIGEVTVYGPLDEERRRAAEAAGVHVEPVPLQDLFVHLTAGGGLAVAAAAYVAAGLVVELALAAATGARGPRLVNSHLFDSASQVHLVVVEYVLAFLAYLVTGWLLGSVYYRFGGWRGTLLAPLALLPLAAVEALIATVDELAGLLGAGPGAAVPLAAGLGLAAVTAGLLTVRVTVRDVPPRPAGTPGPVRTPATRRRQ
jgi:ABC-2 type transport system ATP-binding protein